MAAYIVMRITVNDPQKLKAYQQVAPSVIAKYKGKILARGGEVVAMEGPEEPRRIVMIEFPDMETAQRFYASEEYQNAIAMREGAADFEVIAVRGVD